LVELPIQCDEVLIEYELYARYELSISRAFSIKYRPFIQCELYIQSLFHASCGLSIQCELAIEYNDASIEYNSC
jgi:hypothetical protein